MTVRSVCSSNSKLISRFLSTAEFTHLPSRKRVGAKEIESAKNVKQKRPNKSVKNLGNIDRV